MMKMNKRNKCDGRKLLRSIDSDTIPLVFFDPQYRGVLDHLQYGNEGERQAGRAALTQMSDDTIMEFCQEIARVLKPSGHLMLWVDKFHLVSGVTPWLSGSPLQVVDMITWDKGRIGMGYRTRRKSEYLVVIQKQPTRAKGIWTSHSIPDCWQEKIARGIHAHAKPLSLQQALIEATTVPNDIVVDPCAGSFSVMDAARNAGRNFLGSDLEG